jgi:cytochrome o ubiquinol oxidase subunit 2
MSANYSGFGFSGMKFKTHALDQAGFEQWISKVKRSPLKLDEKMYKMLSKKTKDHAVQHFHDVDPLHFKKTIEKYTGVQSGK